MQNPLCMHIACTLVTVRAICLALTHPYTTYSLHVIDLFNFYILGRARTYERKQSNDSVSSILHSQYSINYFFPSKPSKMENVNYTNAAL